MAGEDAGDGAVDFGGFVLHEEDVADEVAVVEAVDEGAEDVEALVHIGGVVVEGGVGVGVEFLHDGGSGALGGGEAEVDAAGEDGVEETGGVADGGEAGADFFGDGEGVVVDGAEGLGGSGGAETFFKAGHGADGVPEEGFGFGLAILWFDGGEITEDGADAGDVAGEGDEPEPAAVEEVHGDEAGIFGIVRGEIGEVVVDADATIVGDDGAGFAFDGEEGLAAGGINEEAAGELLAAFEGHGGVGEVFIDGGDGGIFADIAAGGAGFFEEEGVEGCAEDLVRGRGASRDGFEFEGFEVIGGGVVEACAEFGLEGLGHLVHGDAELLEDGHRGSEEAFADMVFGVLPGFENEGVETELCEKFPQARPAEPPPITMTSWFSIIECIVLEGSAVRKMRS